MITNAKILKMLTSYNSYGKNDEKSLFDERINPFLFKDKDYSIHDLEDTIRNLFVELELENSDKELINNQLEYMLKCLYASDLVNGDALINACPPFFSLSKYVYGHRLENLDMYKSILTYYVDNISKNTIFWDNNRSVENAIKRGVPGQRIANEIILIDDKTRQELIYDVKKIAITSSIVAQSHRNYTLYKRFLVGEYHGKKVLYAEEIKVPKENGNFKTSNVENVSYQLSIFPKTEGNLSTALLYRSDILPLNYHINKLNGNSSLNTSESDNVVYERNNALNFVDKGHRHMPTEKYTIVFPTYLGSCDTTDVKCKDMSLTSFVDTIRMGLSIEDDRRTTVSRHGDRSKNGGRES